MGLGEVVGEVSSAQNDQINQTLMIKSGEGITDIDELYEPIERPPNAEVVPQFSAKDVEKWFARKTQRTIRAMRHIRPDMTQEELTAKEDEAAKSAPKHAVPYAFEVGAKSTADALMVAEGVLKADNRMPKNENRADFRRVRFGKTFFVVLPARIVID